ncbi:MAG: STAS/SEC14 domain-containing protein [Ignavibacteriaceae bacterium]
MIEYLEIHSIDIIATRVSGKISEGEFLALKEEVTGKINKYGKVSWYYEMSNFSGWDWDIFWREIKFSIRNSSNFERVAFVGENFLENVMAQFSKLFTPAEIKYFDIKNRQDAIEWIKYGIVRNK